MAATKRPKTPAKAAPAKKAKTGAPPSTPKRRAKPVTAAPAKPRKDDTAAPAPAAPDGPDDGVHVVFIAGQDDPTYVAPLDEAHKVCGPLLDGAAADDPRLAPFVGAPPKPASEVTEADVAVFAEAMKDWSEHRSLVVVYNRGEKTLQLYLARPGADDELIDLGPPCREAGFWGSVIADLESRRTLG